MPDTDADWQIISDQKVLDSLESNGDDGSESRKIDHWIYFPDKSLSVDFLIWAKNNEFTEESELSGVSDDGTYCVRLYHNGTARIGDISKYTIALQRSAKEHGGKYDGWETLVIKSDR